MYLVYILQSHNCSYIGMTNNFEKRWKQHNGLLAGGAKYTKKYNDWVPICIVDGFKTKREAMQCEWRLKRVKGYLNRIKYLAMILKKEDRWTKQSPLIKDQPLKVYTTDYYQSYFETDISDLVWY